MAALRVKSIVVMCLILVCSMFVGGGFYVDQAQAGTSVQPGTEDGGYLVQELLFNKSEAGGSIAIKGNVVPTFTTYELFDPLRLVIDIADAGFSSVVNLPIDISQGSVISIAGQVLTDKEPAVAKLEVFLSEDSQYKVNRAENDILINFEPVGKEEVPAEAEVVNEHKIYKVKVDETEGGLSVLLVADSPIEDFIKVELPQKDGRPDRVYFDIKAAAAPALGKIIEVGNGSLAKIRISERRGGVRVVFDSALDELFDYNVAPAEGGLLVTIANPVVEQSVSVVEPANDPVGELLADLDAKKLKGAGSKVKAERPQQNKISESDEFSAAGYNRKRVSVDFYKTNLHNVFRLIGDISGYNMVIDDAVNGSLTLSLQNVPWDFILDVVMNLKGLQKEERYNTIVISPQAKSFAWPEKSLPKDADLKLPEEDVLIAMDSRLTQMSQGEIDSKTKIQEGNRLRDDGKVEKALVLYEKALDLWNDNAELAKQISKMALVELGLNQKGVDYAGKALKIDAEDKEAALLMAIGLANMRQPEAKQYFELAAAGEHPDRAALLNYAAYSEDAGDYGAALSTIDRYETIYEHTLESMIAKARIYDKKGEVAKALNEYQTILYAGYKLDPDLAQYIQGRIVLDNKQ